MDEQPSRRPKRKRWGVRTLGFLTIALASVLTSNLLVASGREEIAPVLLIGVLAGLSGATYCTVRGLKEFNWLQR